MNPAQISVLPNGRRLAEVAPPVVPSVYLAMPSYDGRIEGPAAVSWLQATAGRCRVGQYFHRGSLLANGFNYCWAEALNMAAKGECNRFAMLHSDVCPERVPWVDRLEDILQKTDADVVSVVIPIKDIRGLTSTAIGDPDDEWRTIRRLTVQETLALPETFRAIDCGYPGYPLLVNTGCWLARLDRGEWQRLCHFEIRDRIVERDGELSAECLPEDWHFSRQLHSLCVDVVATRAVAVRHVGRIEFVNNQSWGQCAVDPNYDPERDSPIAAVSVATSFKTGNE